MGGVEKLNVRELRGSFANANILEGKFINMKDLMGLYMENPIFYHSFIYNI